jgi:hypothetical protein
MRVTEISDENGRKLAAGNRLTSEDLAKDAHLNRLVVETGKQDEPGSFVKWKKTPPTHHANTEPLPDQTHEFQGLTNWSNKRIIAEGAT